MATIETLIFPFKLKSSIEPNINSASGSTSALILFTASSTSNNVRSDPPVIFTKRPFAPLSDYSSINGFKSAALVASSARCSPSASPVPIIAFPIPFMMVSTSAKSKFIKPGLTIKSVTL